MNYKAPDNSLHYLDSDEFEHLLPPGSVRITDAEVDALRPKLALADLKANAIVQVRTMRVSVFATLAGIQSQALSNGDTATAKAISGLQDSLKALPDTDLSKCQTQDDIDAAFTAGWVAIAEAAPANVVSAFNEVLS
jgi:hypothetical protein